MKPLSRRLSRRLYMWAVRLDETEWHDVTLLDKDGNKLGNFSCFGDWVASGPVVDDIRCSCEETP